jgi:hypothetical protein
MPPANLPVSASQSRVPRCRQTLKNPRSVRSRPRTRMRLSPAASKRAKSPPAGSASARPAQSQRFEKIARASRAKISGER